MKKLILNICIIIGFCTLVNKNARSQTNIAFQESSQKIEASETSDKTEYIKLKVTGSVNTTSASMTLTFSRNDNPANYSLPSPSFAVSPFATTLEVPINIRRGIVRKTGDTIIISFTDAFTSSIRTTTVIILPDPEKKDETKSERNRIMLLNAYNFDFGSTSLSSNYVGHLNLFAPSLSHDKRWGFNTGVMKINYGQKDTSNSNGTLLRENVFINPFDTLVTGLKYLKQINSYKTEIKNTVWSFYVQPTFEITKKEGQQHIYAHLHMELLATKWSSTTTITTIKQDTGTINQPTPDFVIRSGVTGNNTFSINSLSGYFGAGFTFDLKPWNGGSFFFQPSLGWTSNRPSLYSTDINSNLRGSSIKREKERTWYEFYLIRAYYRHTLSKDATVIVGTDIRGLFPLYAPQYSAYIGLNLGLDSILGLIGGKAKD